LKEEYLLIDGYNIIYAWPALLELSKNSFDAARGKLQDMISNYQGFRKTNIIIVYDAYKVKGNTGSRLKYHNIDIIFTKEAETADQYIEKITKEIAKVAKIRVATSDFMEQLIILGNGATRISAMELLEEVEDVNRIIREEHLNKTEGKRNFLINNLSPEMASTLEKMRLTEDE
jgi:predicted RNA-binding protein with PIN domain